MLFKIDIFSSNACSFGLNLFSGADVSNAGSSTLGFAKRNGILQRIARFEDSAECAEGHLIHGLHPYPAKYIPDLPREIIYEHTNERHVVLDPFCGSGTTLAEASLSGRRSIGIDSNPIAALISKAKTTPLNKSDIEKAEQFAKYLRSEDSTNLPKNDRYIIANQEHWFQSNMFDELGWIKNNIDNVLDINLNTFLLCVFSSIITSVSNQDSDTRYASIEKKHKSGYAVDRYHSKLLSSIGAIKQYSLDVKNIRNTPFVINMSADEVTSDLVQDNSVDLIVTSPPYPNSYDYYLYHKLRMAWLGFDHKVVQKDEIGSRYEHSSRKEPIETFIDRMKPVINNIARMLKPSKLAYFIVGDSVVAGAHINMSVLYKTIAEGSSFTFVDEIEHELATVTRSFQGTRDVAGNSHRHKKLQRIIVFEKRNKSIASPPSSSSASPFSVRTPIVLSGKVKNGSIVAIASNDQDRHIHSLAGFPSKFFPEIPKWAINEYTKKGDTVLDPFSGSGTTAVEALLAGRNAISVDINPYAALLTSAKTTRATTIDILKAASTLENALIKLDRLPKANRLEFDLDDFWFNTTHLEEFARLDKFITKKMPSNLQIFFRAALATTIRAFSYQDLGQIKVKRDPKKVLQGTDSPAHILQKKLANVVPKFIEFQKRLPPDVCNVTITGSANEFSIKGFGDSKVDAIITSPPYINAMNYSMATRYELLLLGLISPDDLIKHQTDYIGTERVYSSEYNLLRQVPDEWSCAQYLNPRLFDIYDSEPKRSFITYDFFMNMFSTFAHVKQLLKSGGKFVLVVGTNNIRNIHIDTFAVLVSILEDMGFNSDCKFHYEIIKQVFKITRHSTASVIPHDGVAVMRCP